jgi:hypothetical protein
MELHGFRLSTQLKGKLLHNENNENDQPAFGSSFYRI